MCFIDPVAHFFTLLDVIFGNMFVRFKAINDVVVHRGVEENWLLSKTKPHQLIREILLGESGNTNPYDALVS